MHDLLQPYLKDLVEAVLGLAVTAILALVARFRVQAQDYISAHTNASQREFMSVVAGEAVAYAATVFKDQANEQRLQGAIDYINKHLPQGWTFTEAELRGAIENAYADYKAKVNAQPVANTTVSVQGDAQKTADVISQALKGKLDAGTISTSPDAQKGI